MYYVIHVKVREQISRVSFLLLCWSQGTISDIHSCQPAWLTEPCHQLIFCCCCCSFVTLLTCFTGIRCRASSCMLYRVTLSLINQSIYLFSPSMSNHTLIWAQTRILLLFLLYFYYLDTFDFFSLILLTLITMVREQYLYIIQLSILSFLTQGLYNVIYLISTILL